MVDIELKMLPYFCSHSRFRINGVTAILSDFGSVYDVSIDSERPRSSGCGNMQFVPHKSVPVWQVEQIKHRYHITDEDIVLIIEALSKAYAFGNCDLCN